MFKFMMEKFVEKKWVFAILFAALMHNGLKAEPVQAAENLEFKEEIQHYLFGRENQIQRVSKIKKGSYGSSAAGAVLALMGDANVRPYHPLYGMVLIAAGMAGVQLADAQDKTNLVELAHIPGFGEISAKYGSEFTYDIAGDVLAGADLGTIIEKRCKGKSYCVADLKRFLASSETTRDQKAIHQEQGGKPVVEAEGKGMAFGSRHYNVILPK